MAKVKTQISGKRAVRNRELVTRVKSLSYDFRTKEGDLYLAPYFCCDMAGCIALFTRIDPQVKLIRTWAGNKPDTVYQLGVGDSPGWTARLG